MDINLSWNLFIIVFFGIILSYSFIVGRNQVLKIIISSYIAMLCADGLGNLVAAHLPQKIIITLLPAVDFMSAIIMAKILIFVTMMVIIAIRGGFDVITQNARGFLEIILTTIFGSLSAILIISTVLYFIAGGSFVTLFNAPSSGILVIKNQSSLARLLVDNYSIWFSLPGLSLLALSLFRRS